jgi:hypothetical protein
VRAVEEVIRTGYGFILAFFGSVPDEMRGFFRSIRYGPDNPDFFFTPLRFRFEEKGEGRDLERRGQQLDHQRRGCFLIAGS